MTLADHLNQTPFIKKMKEYLQAVKPQACDILNNSSCPDIGPLDIFQVMMQACLISENELSKLKDMMEFCSRDDLVKRIDEFLNKAGGFKKGKL